MRKIKKFNELFDDESIKSEHELEYLTGSIYDKIKQSATDNFWQKESNTQADTLLEKLMHRGLYQLLIFFGTPKLAVTVKSWQIQERELFKKTKYPDSIFNLFGIKSGNFELILGIKIIDNNKFDVLLTASNYNITKMNRGISFEELFYFIKYNWLECLSYFKDKAVTEFGKSSFIRQNN